MVVIVEVVIVKLGKHQLPIKCYEHTTSTTTISYRWHHQHITSPPHCKQSQNTSSAHLQRLPDHGDSNAKTTSTPRQIHSSASQMFYEHSTKVSSERHRHVGKQRVLLASAYGTHHWVSATTSLDYSSTTTFLLSSPLAKHRQITLSYHWRLLFTSFRDDPCM